MMRGIIAILIALMLTSCFRLDDNLYNADNEITEYLLDDYDGEQDFVLGSSYTIPDSLVHIFTLNSTIPGESKFETIYAIYIGDQRTINTDTVIMYCHGNKWHMDYYWQRAKLMAHAGGKNKYGVLMIDYRGYGLSSGKPSEKGLYADVDAGLTWLKNKGLTNDKLVIYGFSMGTAPATELSANPRSMEPSKLVLEAPFASAGVMVQDATGLLMPSSFVTNLEIDNAEEIKKVNQPFFWLHGDKDLKNSISTHGQVVYNNYKGSYKQALIVKDADHSGVPTMVGYSNYCSELNSFIER